MSMLKVESVYAPLILSMQTAVLYKYYIPLEGDSQKYHPDECYYQPRRSQGW